MAGGEFVVRSERVRRGVLSSFWLYFNSLILMNSSNICQCVFSLSSPIYFPALPSDSSLLFSIDFYRFVYILSLFTQKIKTREHVFLWFPCVAMFLIRHSSNLSLSLSSKQSLTVYPLKQVCVCAFFVCYFTPNFGGSRVFSLSDVERMLLNAYTFIIYFCRAS